MKKINLRQGKVNINTTKTANNLGHKQWPGISIKLK